MPVLKKTKQVTELESSIPETTKASTASIASALSKVDVILKKVGAASSAFPSFEDAMNALDDAIPDGDFIKVRSDVYEDSWFVWNILPNTLESIKSGQIALSDMHFVQSKKGKIDADTGDLMIYAVTKSSDHVSSKVFSD